jgi:hypothetical protein
VMAWGVNSKSTRVGWKKACTIFSRLGLRSSLDRCYGGILEANAPVPGDCLPSLIFHKLKACSRI